MLVVCPWTRLHPATVRALGEFAPDARMVDVSASNDAYWRLVADLWAGGQAFALVEHDIEPHADVFPAFAACPEPWCVFPYKGPGFDDGDRLLYRALGCVRFSADLLAAAPQAIEAIGRVSDGLPLKDWRRVDTLLACELERAGFRAHAHWPAVIHHHRYDNGPACGGCEECGW